jgi:hypothetical protein
MTKGTRSLLLSLFIAGSALAGANAAYGRYCEGHYIPAATFRAAANVGDRCVVMLGDSRMVEGVDGPIVERALASLGRPCLARLSIGAVGLPGQKMILRRYLDLPRSPRVIVLGTSAGAVLPERTLVDPAQMIGNRAIELGWSRSDDFWLFYGHHLPEGYDPAIRYALNRMTSLQAYASLTWFKTQRFQDRITGAEDLGPSNRFGAIDDMRELATSVANQVEASLRHWDGRWRTSGWFDEVLRLAKTRQAKLVLVNVPMTSVYRNRIASTPALRRYDDWLKAELAQSGIDYLDFSDVAPDTAFQDGLHVGAEGARIFSEALGRSLAHLRPTQ